MESLSHDVVNMKGKKVGSIDLDPEVFAAAKKDSLVHSTVRWQLLKRRAGTHAALNRKVMKGGGRKPFRQKGTGRARAGSTNSPTRVGGAVIFGPRPRDYSIKLQRKVRRKAMLSVLTEKYEGNQIVILDELKVDSGKTKDICAVLQALGIKDKSITIVLPEKDSAEKDSGVWRSSGNLKNVVALPVAGVNVYDLLKFPCLVSTREGIQSLQSRLKTASGDSGSQKDKAEEAAK